MTLIYDAIVIGGGPAGALFSHLFAKRGKRVLLLETYSEVKRKVCGEYLCPSGVEVIHELGLDRLFDGFLDVEGMNIYTPKEREVKTHFPCVEKRINIGKSLNREIFDQRLLDLANESGTEIKMGVQVRSVVYEGTLWKVECLDGAIYHTRLLIGADGRNSLVGKSIGATVQGVQQKRVALHAWVDRLGRRDRVGEMHLYSDGSYIGVDPTSETELNVSLVCDASLIKKYGGASETLNHYIQSSQKLSAVVGNIRDGEMVYSVSPIRHEVSSYNLPNVALIGDSAGFLDPLTGEGLFNALAMAKQLI